MFGQSTLGSEKDTIEQTKIGALDMVRVNVAPFNNIVPETIVPSLPFLFKSKEHMRKVLDGPIGDEILAALEAQGFIGLAFYDSRLALVLHRQEGDQDARRHQGHEDPRAAVGHVGRLMQAMGANATPMPYAEVYTALKTGVVDGAENNWPSYESSRHYEVAKIYSLTEHSMAPELLVFSKKVWDTLAKESRTIIRDAAKESVPYMRKLWDEREAKARETVEAGGAQIVSDVDKKSFSGRDEAGLRQVRRRSRSCRTW